MSDVASAELPLLDDAAYQRALAILLDVGTSIALELKAPSKDVSLPARTLAFKQVDETIRRTIILSKHIADTPTPMPGAKRIRARREVIRAVEASIEHKAKPADAHALRVELLERVDSLEFVEELEHRSPGELIVELCRDLGLSNIPGLRNYPRRTPDDIAILCAQAAAPAGSGLPQWLAAAQPQAAENDAASLRLALRERAGGRAPPHADPPPSTTF